MPDKTNNKIYEKTSGKESSQRWLIITILAAATLVAFWPVLDAGFVVYDDGLYVTENSVVTHGLTGFGVEWAFFTGQTGNWHPITWVSHMLDVTLYKANPMGHHLTSLLFHLVNSVLLFLLLELITGWKWRSCFVALLFAVHPMHVESVAWISERKDVLSTFFMLAALFAYTAYTRKMSVYRYLSVFILFMLGLMAKSMLVTLPVLLLLLDFWPMGRFRDKSRSVKLLIEKLPLLFLSAAVGIITVFMQRSAGAVVMLEQIKIGMRLANAAVTPFFYIKKMLWPTKLAVFYPHPQGNLPVWQTALSIMLIIGITAFAVKFRKKLPYIFVGWMWYIISLLPVVGIVQVGRQGAADRYTYIPFIGLFVIIAWGIPALVGRFSSGAACRALVSAAVIAVLVLTVCTRIQASYWHDSVSLFEHALASTKDNFVARFNLGVTLGNSGSFEEAVKQFEEALKIDPTSAEAHFDIALLLDKLGRIEEAIPHYKKSIEYEPGNPQAHYNLGVAYDSLQTLEYAIAEYKVTLEIDPGHNEARNNLAVAYYQAGRYSDAWEQVQALRARGFEPHAGFLDTLSQRMPEPSVD